MSTPQNGQNRRLSVPVTLRFDRFSHALITEQARAGGVTAAQFIREAAVIRAALRAEHYRDPEDDARVTILMRALASILAESDDWQHFIDEALIDRGRPRAYGTEAARRPTPGE